MKKQQTDSSEDFSEQPKLRKYKRIEDRPLLAKTRMPVQIADYLLARTHERNGKYRTTRELAVAIVGSFLEEAPWRDVEEDYFARSRVSKKYSGPRPKEWEFVQFNLFVPAEQRRRLDAVVTEKHVSLSSILLTAVYWWILRDGHAAKYDPEIAEIVRAYWRLPEHATKTWRIDTPFK